jgi:hypothetical protein
MCLAAVATLTAAHNFNFISAIAFENENEIGLTY